MNGSRKRDVAEGERMPIGTGRASRGAGVEGLASRRVGLGERGGRWALVALIGGASGIGFAPILVRWSEVGPSATAGYRVLLSLPVLWLVVWLEGRRDRTTGAGEDERRAGSWGWLVLAGVLFAADLGLWHWSLQYTSVANSTLIINFTPVLVTFGAWLFLGERLCGSVVLGMAIGLGGVLLLVAGSVGVDQAKLRGDLLALVATGFYGGYLLVVKRLRGRLSTAWVMAGSGLAMCPAAFIFALAAEERLWPGSGRGWAVLLGLALVSHVGGQVLIAYGLGHLSASFSAVGLFWQPVVAALAAWFFLHERPTVLQGVGGVAVLAAIVVAGRGRGGGAAVGGQRAGAGLS